MAFASDKRSVELSGEAYFDVVKNEQCPMLISLKNNYMIEVLGTQFNVRAYEDEEDVQTALYSGVINLLKDDAAKQSVNKVLNINVCIDLWDYQPVSEVTLVNYIKQILSSKMVI